MMILLSIFDTEWSIGRSISPGPVPLTD